MKWETSISHVEDGKELIRGYDLQDLIKEKGFVEAIFLVLKGELPNANETRMMNALFTASIDHGIGTSSAITARTVVSTGNSLHAALAAGILALGKLHGSAIEGAAKFFQDHAGEDPSLVAKTEREAKRRIPGYGHKILETDPRSASLFEAAKEMGFYGKHCKFAEELLVSINELSSKILPINVDGSMAAILSDMGFDWRITKGIFIIGRTPGLVAHVFEEMTSGDGLRRLGEDEATYTGPSKRTLTVVE
jgi:citryl-CoA lyase